MAQPCPVLSLGEPQVSPTWLMRHSQLGHYEATCFTSLFYPRLPAAARVWGESGEYCPREHLTSGLAA